MGGTDTSWQATYRVREAQYSRLRDEVVFALTAETERAGIKLHSLTSRVKSLESLAEKAERKSYTSPLAQAPDVVGVRVVALFLSDLPRITDIVQSVFTVLRVDDKIDGGDDLSTFGYMSQHYEARIPSEHIGPRYDDIRDITFEVQVRTILMDAWANVSHYLAYKGESSIPEELRRDFMALSGLFYVADKHFELFIGRAQTVRDETDELIRTDLEDVDLSLDSLAAFLEQRFPDRKRGSRQALGEVTAELLRFGYNTLSKLDAALTETAEQFADEERQMGEGFYSDVGVVRRSLAATHPEWDALLRVSDDDDDDDPEE